MILYTTHTYIHVRVVNRVDVVAVTCNATRTMIIRSKISACFACHWEWPTPSIHSHTHTHTQEKKSLSLSLMHTSYLSNVEGAKVFAFSFS